MTNDTGKKGSEAVVVTPELAAKIDELRPPELDEIDQLLNSPVIVSIKGVDFRVCAVPMERLPELQRRLKVVGEIDFDNPDKFTEAQVAEMASIVHEGLKICHPNLTVDRLKQLPLSAFPKLLTATLDVSDFFDQMKSFGALAEARPPRPRTTPQ